MLELANIDKTASGGVISVDPAQPGLQARQQPT
jgi:hypothetical protein